MPSYRTIRIEAQDVETKQVLGKTLELAGPDFDLIVIVHDVVIRFEAAMVEVLVLVDARIVVVGKA